QPRGGLPVNQFCTSIEIDLPDCVQPWAFIWPVAVGAGLASMPLVCTPFAKPSHVALASLHDCSIGWNSTLVVADDAVTAHRVSDADTIVAFVGICHCPAPKRFSNLRRTSLVSI